MPLALFFSPTISYLSVAGFFTTSILKHLNALLIFIKNSEKGKVKTRLAKTVGDAKALEIYHALLDHTRKVALATSADRLLFYSNYIEENDAWAKEAFDKYVQQGDDLGKRMENGFAKALENHDKAVIIGSDCASLTAGMVEEAFTKLDEHPYVLGPAMDGGYYLLGMRTPTPTLFQDVAWSTEEVAKVTLAKIEAMGKSCYQLPTLSDIDYWEDWEKYGWKL